MPFELFAMDSSTPFSDSFCLGEVLKSVDITLNVSYNLILTSMPKSMRVLRITHITSLALNFSVSFINQYDQSPLSLTVK